MITYPAIGGFLLGAALVLLMWFLDVKSAQLRVREQTANLKIWLIQVCFGELSPGCDAFTTDLPVHEYGVILDHAPTRSELSRIIGIQLTENDAIDIRCLPSRVEDSLVDLESLMAKPSR